MSSKLQDPAGAASLLVPERQEHLLRPTREPGASGHDAARLYDGKDFGSKMMRSLLLCWLLVSCALQSQRSDAHGVAGSYTMWAVDVWPHLVLEGGGRFLWCVETNLVRGATTTGRWEVEDGVVRLAPDQPSDPSCFWGSLRVLRRDGRCVLVPVELADGFDFERPECTVHFASDATGQGA